jgi:hypothetical protein
VAVLIGGLLPLRVGATLGTVGLRVVPELTLVPRMLLLEVGTSLCSSAARS